jgi:GNAT superfamily N-acetyltransferase
MTTIVPLHKWTVARGSQLILAAPDAEAIAWHKRPRVPLLFLTELWVPLPQRGKGAAHSLLKAATDWADAESTDLWLYVAPHGREPRLGTEQLMALYTRYGFAAVPGGSVEYEMVRRYEPRNPD